MDLLWLELAVATGAFVQGSIGFGFALASAPVVALLAPESLPGSLLLISLPLNLWVAGRERKDVDRRGLLALIAGLIPGTAVGVLVLIATPGSSLSVAFGCAIVAGAVLSLVHAPYRVRPGAALVAGAGSGLINTVAATGGPVVAMLYQRRPLAEMRGTLAATFLVSQILSLAAVAAGGLLDAGDLRLGAVLLPGLALGLATSVVGARLVRERWLRPAVLAFSLVAGAAAIARGLV